ncbi:MAG: hypothetical protein AAGI03_02730 [Pseudomonadota bacterium]
MGEFIITAPDGKKYRVTGENEQGALQALRKKLDREMSFDGSHAATLSTRAANDLFGPLDAFSAGTLNEMTFGAADEAQSWATGEDVEAIRSRDKVRQTNHPGFYDAGRFVGGAASAALPVGTALALTRGASLGARAVTGASAGAADASFRAFLDGEKSSDSRLKDATDPVTLGVGAVAGGAVPIAGRAAGQAARWWTERKAPQVFQHIPDKAAARQISAAFRDDVSDEATLRDYLGDLGPEGMVADVGNNTKSLAGGIVSLPGRSGQSIFNAMEGRHKGRADRIEADLNDYLGEPGNMEVEKARLAQVRRDNAGPAYDQFNATMFPLDDELRAAIQRADQVGALADARQIATARGYDFSPEAYLDPNAVEIQGEALDVISQAIRDKAQAAWQAGQGGLGRPLQELEAQFLSRVPGLSDIRTQYAMDSRVIEAAESGGDILKPKVSHDQLQERFKNMTPEEVLAFQLSGRSAIEERLANAVDEGRAGANLLRTRAIRNKIGVAFGPEASQALARRMEAEQAFADSRNTVARNSQTAARRAAQRELGPLLDEAGHRKGPIGRARQASGDVGNDVLDALMRKQPGPRLNALGDALTAQGSDRDKIIQALLADMDQMKLADMAEGQTRRLAHLLMGAATGASAAAMQ